MCRYRRGLRRAPSRKEKEAQEAATAEGAAPRREGKPRIKKAVKASIDAEEAALAEVVAATEAAPAAEAVVAETVVEEAPAAEQKAE